MLCRELKVALSVGIDAEGVALSFGNRFALLNEIILNVFHQKRMLKIEFQGQRY